MTKRWTMLRELKPVQKDERKLVGSAGSDYLFLSRGAEFIRGMLV